MDIKAAIFSLQDAGEIIVPDCVAEELKGLSEKYPDAKAGLALIDKFQRIESTGRGDDCIVKQAAEMQAFVLTNDRGLVSRLKSSGVRVLSIRGGNTIDFV